MVPNCRLGWVTMMIEALFWGWGVAMNHMFLQIYNNKKQQH
jgi:hypothetical protein